MQQTLVSILEDLVHVSHAFLVQAKHLILHPLNGHHKFKQQQQQQQHLMAGPAGNT
jgi:hypothetical protein